MTLWTYRNINMLECYINLGPGLGFIKPHSLRVEQNATRFTQWISMGNPHHPPSFGGFDPLWNRTNKNDLFACWTWIFQPLWHQWTRTEISFVYIFDLQESMAFHHPSLTIHHQTSQNSLFRSTVHHFWTSPQANLAQHLQGWCWPNLLRVQNLPTALGLSSIMERTLVKQNETKLGREKHGNLDQVICWKIKSNNSSNNNHNSKDTTQLSVINLVALQFLRDIIANWKTVESSKFELGIGVPVFLFHTSLWNNESTATYLHLSKELVVKAISIHFNLLDNGPCHEMWDPQNMKTSG